MRCILRNFGILSVALLVASCSSRKQGDGTAEQEIGLVVLDPGHFHASLLQKRPLPGMGDTVWVYAPLGTEVQSYLDDIDTYNQRSENPTQWIENVYTGSDYLSQMIARHKGNVVVLAGNNQKKAEYISEAIKAGYNVLSDKPLAINKQDFELLASAYQTAKEKGLFLYDLMTERYDILNIVEKKLLHNPELFGELQKGTPDAPAVYMESVHHFFKMVSGKPLTRPAWYYDVAQQGEGIADVTTHLIDLTFWQCFPDEAIHYSSDVEVLQARHWPTRITLPEYSQSTQVDSFPPYLNKYIKSNALEVMANGSLTYAVKGINVEMKVTWNYTPPTGGSDTFSSVKKGSKATLKTIQNEETGFVKQLYIQRNAGVDAASFKEQLEKAVKGLQTSYPFISVEDEGEGLFLINIPQENRLGHEDHFSKVAEAFISYLRNKDIPEWENENTLSKYYITTTAVELAGKGTK